MALLSCKFVIRNCMGIVRNFDELGWRVCRVMGFTAGLRKSWSYNFCVTGRVWGCAVFEIV